MSDRTLPHLALSAHAHNREGLHRTDDAWLADRWADPSTRVLVLAGARLELVDGAPRWLGPDEAPDGERILLGDRDGVTRFAVLVDPEDAPEGEWVGLRGAFAHLLGHHDEAPWLFHAVGLAEWRRVTRHCPRCGGVLEPRRGGHELRCTSCGRPQFPRTDPAVIMAVVDDETGEVLLGRQSSWPENRYSTLAGFLEPGESFEDAVRREVLEEVGVEVGRVDYFGNQPWPLPASVMIGFVAYATSREIHVDGSEIAHARWFSREDFGRATESGEIAVPQGVSISSSLIQDWYGAPVESSGW